LRIGHGTDIHRLVKGRPLYLGGVLIPSEKGEAGHSDGDVLIHAIIDAIFGSVADGDIGSHYPPSDMKYKDISSALLLQDAMKRTGVKIINLDATVILEMPKLRPYIDGIRENLAQILGIETGQVSIKAKTAEGILAELGKGDAIAAEAVVLIA
jgi:2-C-methyl-D-erythritol 2,4-cyclodiphosphate synthase